MIQQLIMVDSFPSILRWSTHALIPPPFSRRLCRPPRALSLTACNTAPPAPQPLKVIGFLSDFDVKDDAIGICKAVMEGIAPGVRVIDITHQVTPYDIAQGARFLAGSAPYFPKDAVFVGVVDPGVGSTRKPIIAKSKIGQFFVVPDNGLLTLVQDRDGIEAAREITNPDWMIGSKLSSTFHGRDIFSPAGAHLARGDDWTQAGPALDVAQLVRLDIPTAAIDAKGLHGDVIGTDGPYGNLILDIPSPSSRSSATSSATPFPSPSTASSTPSPSTKPSAMSPSASLSSTSTRAAASPSPSTRATSPRRYRISPPAQLLIPRKP
jgi:S-adenosylmethionine hydrolase